ncbi:unnamed protein product [Mesocestoides corti]|uniref:m7GpppX diphosphatase n=1 Tax=Mesocestoides corti TaxID=53468 RepID=A0A0R3UML9_MESCO|nr:unnamed protein product [Mesocestoides corti]
MISSDPHNQVDNSPTHTANKSLNPPLKRRRTSSKLGASPPPASNAYCPSKTRILRVLRNDTRAKAICLHVKFSESMDKDSIVILQKSPFPNDVADLCGAHVGTAFTEDDQEHALQEVDFPTWKANEVVGNDIYHRFTVKSGLEETNDVNMTVIHPAESHHFAKYSSSRRLITSETPEIYSNVIVPFISSNPKDLRWVDNILDGTAEADRVLYSDEDADLGFTLVLDYRWNGCQLHELHALAIARNSQLTCLRDLRACHIPMLKKMLSEGKRKLVLKYSDQGKEPLREDQIIAYFHYPPTFYRLHMHFIHVDGPADGGTQVGKAHLAEDVVFNVEMKSSYYAERTMATYLHENHPFLRAIRDYDAK